MPKQTRKPDPNAIIGWMRSALGLEDWEILVQISESPPEGDREQVVRDQVSNQCEINGLCHADPLYKKALIWVRNKDATATLGHEMCHIVAADLGIQDDTADRFEFMWSRLGDVLAQAYKVRPRGKKIK